MADDQRAPHGIQLRRTKGWRKPELRRPIARLVLCARDHPAFTCAWSRWRRHGRAAAALCRWKRRTQTQLEP